MKERGILRQMCGARQIEAADLMIGQNNFTVMFAQAIRAATSESQLLPNQKRKMHPRPIHQASI